MGCCTVKDSCIWVGLVHVVLNDAPKQKSKLSSLHHPHYAQVRMAEDEVTFVRTYAQDISLKPRSICIPAVYKHPCV